MDGARVDRERWSEATWVLAAQAGDLACFDLLARRYRPAALILARQSLNGQDAEDAVQDAFLAAFKALPQLDEPDRFAAWLGTIVRHRAFRIGRDSGRAQVPLDRLILSYAPSIVRDLSVKERNDSVRCAIAALPVDIRTPVSLYYLVDWSVTQISEFLSIPPSTVKWRLHRGRQLLRARLAPYEELYDE